MNGTRSVVLLAAVAAGATGGVAMVLQHHPSGSVPAAMRIATTPQQGQTGAAAAQDTGRAHLQRLMRQKVDRAELILRGLAQGDLASVAKAADELVQIAAEANWSLNPRAGEAAANEAEFQRRTALLAKFARDGDIHGTYYQFLQVVFQCFDCHQELRPPGYVGP